MGIYVYALGATLQYTVYADTRREADQIIIENDSAHPAVDLEILTPPDEIPEFQYADGDF